MSAFQVGSSTLLRTLPLAEADDARLEAAHELRQCHTHSRRVPGLLATCWEQFDNPEAEHQAEAAQCLLAAVDDAARAARTMLEAMGLARDVQEWEQKTKEPATPKPVTRGAYGK